MTKNPTTTASKKAAHTSVSGIPTTPFKYLFYLAKRRTKLGILAMSLATVWDVLGLASPLVLGAIVDGFTTLETPEEQLASFQFWAIVLIITMIFLYISARSSRLLVDKWIAEIGADSVMTQVQYVQEHSHRYYSDRLAGSISSKIGSASDGLQGFMYQAIYDGYGRFVSIVTVGITITFVDWRFGLTFFTFAVSVLLVDIFMVKRRRKYIKAHAEANAIHKGKAIDLLTNIAAVRQYVQKGLELSKMNEVLSDRKEKFITQSYKMQQVAVTNNVIVLTMNVIILLLLFDFFAKGTITAGAIVIVVLLVGRASREINGLSGSVNNLGKQYGDIQNGLEDVFVPHEVVDVANASVLMLSNGKIEWQNVQYAYGDNQVFNDFNLAIEPGERVGLVGPSGAGKTTFVSLLLRQHDIDSGAILIDGQDISQVTQDSLRENIAVVPQEPLLFHRSIQENIAYGKPDASDEEIIAVAKKAQAHDFIKDLPEGYDTLVGERGVKLSGGQKQRVAIARAMLKDAPILVLDEATSALDSESEVAIQKALHELMAGKTVVAIAHRLSTLREMDRIIVMEEGRVVEDGTHEELSHAHGTYQRLWEHQAGGFLQEQL